MQFATAVICLIACHGASADHFSVFAKKLSDEGVPVLIFSSEHALKKFQDREVPVAIVFDPAAGEEEKLALKLALSCYGAVAVTDVGHPFNRKLHEAMMGKALTHIAYYDNPEPFVPGGYSAVAGEVMAAADRILFANANLSSDSALKDVPLCKRIGLGYYPVAAAEKVAKRRSEEGEKLRQRFLGLHGLEDQKILVYFGGNNEEYYGAAFPAFLNCLEADLPNTIFVLQQHPAAKTKNLDRQMLEEWKLMHPEAAVIVSEWNSEDIQVIADGALYYQTSMGPQFALAGIPMLQIGHKTMKM